MSSEKIWSKEHMDDIRRAPNFMIPIFEEVMNVSSIRKILDLGCGNGYFSSYLKKYPIQLHGVDGSSYGVEESLKNGFDQCVVVKNFDTDPLPSEHRYDLVICKDVLEHVLHPDELIEKARQLLTENGQILILVPNHFPLFHRLKFVFSGDIDVPSFFPETPKWAYPHIRFLKSEDFSALFVKSGLRIKKDYSSRFGFFMPRGNGLLSRLGALEFLASKYPNLFSTAYCFLLEKN